ncbi:MAG: queuosine precursor transporter [Paludibacteraceae bacterium]|nr:queuosine precursor transporter [Paludibacteraceae bacterium]
MIIFLIEIIFWYLLLWLASRRGFEGLLAFVIVASITATIEAGQNIILLGYHLNGGCIPFATLFLATDIASELQGKRESRSLVNYSGVAILLFPIVIALFGIYEGVRPAWYDTLGGTIRISVASVITYLLCGYVDIMIYHSIGRISKFKWLRNNIATITSQFINAAMFITLAFGWNSELVVFNAIVSTILALLDTPMIYIITGKDKLL